MKYLLMLAFIVASNAFAETDGTISPPEASAKLIDYQIPINHEAEDALNIILKHLDCSLEEYLKMSGIAFPEGASCSLDTAADVFKVRLEHEYAAKVVAILGDMMLATREHLTPEQLLERYTRRYGEKFPLVEEPIKKENKPEMGTPNRPPK